MKYWMLRLFLTRRDQGTMFERLQPSQSRQDYLRQVFSSEIRFQHWQKPYVYKPFEAPDDFHTVGVIGREHTVTISGPPEEQFAAKDIPDWETSNVLIDTSGAEEGQKVAMQQVSVIGQPISVFRSLVDDINHRFQAAEWTIAVNPITKKDQFWAVAEEYKGNIQELDLSFVTPNIWGGTSETENALKKLKADNNAQEVEVRLKNKEGKLEPDSENVRKSVDYITRGGGTLRLKGPSGAVVYSSEQEESVVTVSPDPDFPIQHADKGMIQKLIERIFK